MALNKMKRQSKFIDTLLSERQYICGDKLTIADFQFFYEYGNIDLYGLDWKYENVERWRQRMMEVPEVRKVMEQYNRGFKEMKEMFDSIQPPEQAKL